ncbi:MAG: PSD1 domain-containing protein [Planctomycetes bacterium]|nr:PSD1 domain-containing protein [Planctomycetota bacterium]
MLVIFAGVISIFLARPTLVAAAEAPAKPTAEQVEFFEKRVRPILIDRCFDCHGEDEAESKLRLDSLAGMLKGGTRGPAIVRGKPKKSLLIIAINHGELLQMPEKEKLPTREIMDLTAWVKMGAPWPNAILPAVTADSGKVGKRVFTEKEKNFWAFRKVDPGQPPQVKDAGWLRSPIDRYVLARLEAKGLRPAPAADKRTLIRRTTFDLTGLPPTPEEIKRFLDDTSAAAYENLIDRLLASPRYGERWGRHWLDVARYADSNGMDENLAFIQAFRYRDWVIKSFNNDLPYDRFVHEQLAGDLLPKQPGESAAAVNGRRIATGFLSIGPKMLADDDPVKKEMDIIDEQITTVTKAFMGLTLECARCHDHKFDPLTMVDYYALAGIFKSTKTMNNFKVVAEWHEYDLNTPGAQKEHQQKLAELDRRIGELSTVAGSNDSQQLADLRSKRQQLTANKPQGAKAMGVTEGKVQNVRIHLRGSTLTLGREVPRQFPQIIAGDQKAPVDAKQSGRLQFARWLTSADHPLTSRVMVNRIWRWHFAAGLVRTPDNFGRLGQRPTHPRLLDWLAREFVAHKWSIKQMHREIMRSSTYRMSTSYDAKAVAVDPENRLLWRFNRRRMEAEEVRDAILAMGDHLDLTLGGQLMKFKNRAYVTGVAGVGATLNIYNNNRRSVYQPVLRSAVYQVFQAFDFADPSVLNGRRATTTVTPQALFMMNSDLMSDNAARMAEGLLARGGVNDNVSDTVRIALVYEKALGRPPSAAESARMIAFVQQIAKTLQSQNVPADQARQKAWRSLCRVVLSSNEFIYIE